jgi:hypothetical protein
MGSNLEKKENKIFSYKGWNLDDVIVTGLIICRF